MTTAEWAEVTDEQWSTLQQWIIKHDSTVKYIAVIMTAMLILNILQSFGVLPL